MFLNRKSLIIHNQRRAKNHIELIKNELLKEVDRVVNEENLTLEHQDSDNNEIFRRSIKKILENNLKIWSHE